MAGEWSPYMTKERQPTITLASGSEGSGTWVSDCQLRWFLASLQFRPGPERVKYSLQPVTKAVLKTRIVYFQLPMSSSSIRETVTPSQIGYYSKLPSPFCLWASAQYKWWGLPPLFGPAQTQTASVFPISVVLLVFHRSWFLTTEFKISEKLWEGMIWQHALQNY